VSRFNNFNGFARNCLLSVLTVLTGFFALAVALPGCPGKDNPVYDRGGSAGIYEAALSGDTAVRGPAAAYWVVERIEGGAADGEGIAVLENIETRRTAEYPVKDLSIDIKEGQVLTDDGTLRIDQELTAVRAARIMWRFERLKTN